MSKTGMIYDMSHNERAQAENLLQAMGYVPYIHVSALGDITINGSSTFKIYLNGKPYEIAEANPKDVFSSIPASEISKVEVITEPDMRFGNSGGTPVINIVTKGKIMDGWNLNLSAIGNTSAEAHGSILWMGKKDKVDFSLNYIPDYTTQRNQIADNETLFYNSDGTEHHKSTYRSVGDGS